MDKQEQWNRLQTIQTLAKELQRQIDELEPYDSEDYMNYIDDVEIPNKHREPFAKRVFDLIRDEGTACWMKEERSYAYLSNLVRRCLTVTLTWDEKKKES